MKWLSEALKADAAIAYQALATPAPGIRSRYFQLGPYGKLLFAFIVDTLAAAETVVATIIEAVNNAGGSAAAIATATCTITANTLATIVTATLVTTAIGNTITINGVTFTAAAAADLPNRVFSQAGDDTADAASLVEAINHAAAQALFLAQGFLISATSALGVVTIVATEPGAGVLTVTRVGAPITLATVQAIGYIEVDATALTAGFNHVALQLVGPATANAAVLAIRGEARSAPVAQAMAAHDRDPVIT